MWGGWYADERLMSELSLLKDLNRDSVSSRRLLLESEVVVFADERAYSRSAINYRDVFAIKNTRAAITLTGVPFDCCMVEDVAAVIGKYRAAVFLNFVSSSAGEEAKSVCKRAGVPFIAPTPGHPSLDSDELKAFLTNAGVHSYTDENDVIFAGNGYLCYHSAREGVKTIRLPKPMKLRKVLGADEVSESKDTVSFYLKSCETAVFEVE